MAVLVTGGSGYIGSCTAFALKEAGEEPIIIDNLSATKRWYDATPRNVTAYFDDIDNTKVIDQIFQKHDIEAIMHFAASVSVAESVTNPEKYYYNNTVKTLNLIRKAKENNVKHFIFSSTAAVYGNPKTDDPVTEDTPLNPLSPYGSSKMFAEKILSDIAFQSDLSFMILRYFNVAGADYLERTGPYTENPTHLITVACRVALGIIKELPVYGVDYDTKDGSCIRDYIHVNDVVQANIESLRYLRAGGKSTTLNCASGKGTSVLEIIEAINRFDVIPIKASVTNRRPGDSPKIIADCSKANEILDIDPIFNHLDDIVYSALEWERKEQRKHTEETKKKISESLIKRNSKRLAL